ncbi:hypothetical protein [[Eubacterium] cellulosolvens]
MKKFLGVLCVLAIVVNIYFGIYLDGSNEKWTGEHGSDSDDEINYSDFSVTVPERMVGDSAIYEYSIFAEMFWENTSSGEWEKYTLAGNGQLIDRVPEIIEKKDGFNTKHTCMWSREETAAEFTIVMDGSDAEQVVIHGNLEGVRDEYIEIHQQKVIQVVTDGKVEVDKIRQMPTPLSYQGYMRNFPDPNLAREESLDEQIFLKSQLLKLGDDGKIITEPESDWYSEWLTQTYNWSVIGGEKVAGYNTLIINISTGFFQNWLPFTKKVWVANEVSYPVKVFVRTNTSAEDDNGSFYTIIEHTRTLKENGFTRGNKEIPWELDFDGFVFYDRHPTGEYREWEYIPETGSRYERSSFDFKPEDAVQFALDNSPELRQFVNHYEDVIITSAAYNVERDAMAELDPAGKAGSYNWNLSFRYKPTRDEIIEAWQNDDWPDWSYYVNLTRNVTKEAGIDKYTEEIKIINEYSRGGSAPYSKSDFPSQVLTLDSSEAILKLDAEIKDKVFNTIDNEINFRDTTYALVMGDITASNMPGMEIVETITGITLPTSKFSWAVQKGTVYKGGNTFSAAVDVETGQLLYVLDITGNELYGIFN